jgi:hypothetical protein
MLRGIAEGVAVTNAQAAIVHCRDETDSAAEGAELGHLARRRPEGPMLLRIARGITCADNLAARIYRLGEAGGPTQSVERNYLAGRSPQHRPESTAGSGAVAND